MSPYEVLDLAVKYSIFSLAIAIIIFSIQLVREGRNKKKESKERISRVCKTLLVEIDQLDKWYDSPEYTTLLNKHYISEFTGSQFLTEYSENIINIMVYQGLANSGLITYLDVDTQAKLNEYFFIADVHNKRMYSMSEVYNYKASIKDFKIPEDLKAITNSEAWKLNEIELTNYEKKMKALMPEIKDLLNDEIKEASKPLPWWKV